MSVRGLSFKQLTTMLLAENLAIIAFAQFRAQRVVLNGAGAVGERFSSERSLDLVGAARLFYTQNVFRFTEDGSSREEWQCGVELIGDSGHAGDVEIVLPKKR